MTLKIEVGDKVRIVAEGVYGHGAHGMVIQGPDEFGGCLVRLRPDDNCWFMDFEIALYADELEDMPEDTVVTRSNYKGRCVYARKKRGTP